MKLNWKKILIVSVLTFTIGIISIVTLDKLGYDFKVLSNDSGFDSDFGGSSGGSSGETSGSDEHYDGYNVYNAPAYLVVIAGILIIVFCCYILYLFNSASKSNIDAYNEMLRKYGIDNIDILKQKVYESYVKIQEAWSENDIDKVRYLLSDEMYNTYKMQILTMITKNQRNAMSDFKYIDAYIDKMFENDNKIVIAISLDVYCKDYMIDNASGQIIKGDSKHTNFYRYLLTFDLGKNNNLENCPNCFAKLPAEGASVKCSYCGNVVVRNSDNLVLIDKKMIKQKYIK